MIEDESFPAYPLCFDENNGMPSRQCSGHVYPSVWISGDGKLLYPTIRGVSVFNPRSVQSDSTYPQIILEKFLVDKNPVSIGKIHIDNFSGNIFDFYFTAIDFSAPEDLRFEYMLKGQDSGFTQIRYSLDRHVSYHLLPAGHYRFSANAVSSRGLKNRNPFLFSDI